MKRNNISKEDILYNIKKNNGLPISYSEIIFSLIFKIIKFGLKRDGNLKISKFGTFKVLNKKARVGMNPKNKTKYLINPRKVVIFSPSNVVKKKLNGK